MRTKRTNHTAQDAFERVLDASLGSMIDIREEYLVALRVELLKWLDILDSVHSRVRLEVAQRQREADI